jgi:indolepyruvate ferredoxin oxidoreductase beta subunit
MERKLIIAGIGGQGVIFATKVVSHAALARGEHVMASENHGMSQRGGSVVAHVRFGRDKAPLIRQGTADALIGLDRVETLRNLLFVRPGGSVYVNSANGLEAVVADRLKELRIDVFAIDASACAKALGSPTATNLVVLGFAAAHADFGLSVEELSNAVRTLGPARAIELNLSALEMGAQKCEAIRHLPFAISHQP